MPVYTQEGQHMRVDTALPDDVLLLAGFHGREEVSEPFVFYLELLSEDPDLDPDDLLRTPISIGILLPDGEMRRIHGRVRSFGYEGRRGDLNFYRAEMVPWLWFLSLSQDCRIFQNMTVPDILAEVFSEEDGAQFKTQFAHEYAEREYCVQYRESNLNFVSRLMEEEGIFYFFEHTEEGHTLVLSDYPQMQPCDGQAEVRLYDGLVPQQDVVRSLTLKQSVYTGTMTLVDYDQMKPSLELEGSISGDESNEIYQYQKSLFTELDQGERFARIALEREEAKQSLARGQSSCRGFEAGRRFRLTEHDRQAANREYALLEVSHSAQSGSYLSGGGSGEVNYENRFVAIPYGAPYRPPLRASKPAMPGAQTARVVGPPGEEINVDEHGRVKIQFHWDRLGGNDANSSCWVRVSQNWAGKGWGGMFIPHVGQEVIVSFLEGDPDRPIITGRVYNAEHMPPQDLPANKHKSIIQDDFGNEMVFDATPGQEHIRIHSPSHLSTIELGKSIVMRTVSDLVEFIDGDSGKLKLGRQFGGWAGFKGDVELGGSFKFSAGFKLDMDVSERTQVSLGPSVKFVRGKEYNVGKSTFTQHSAEDAILDADENVIVTGGIKDQSLLRGSAQDLLLQYGENSGKTPARAFTAAHVATLIGTIAGLTAAVGQANMWQGQEARDAAAPWMLGAGGLGATMLAYRSTISAAMKGLMGKAEDEQDTTPSRHNKVHARVQLDETGAYMSGLKDNAEVSRVMALGAGFAVVTGDEAVNVTSPRGEVVVEASKTVDIDGRTGVNIDSSSASDVKVKGRRILLG